MFLKILLCYWVITVCVSKSVCLNVLTNSCLEYPNEKSIIWIYDVFENYLGVESEIWIFEEKLEVKFGWIFLLQIF